MKNKDSFTQSELYEQQFHFRSERLNRNVFAIIVVILLLVYAANIIFHTIYSRVEVSGPSMNQTLVNGDLVYVDRYAKAQRGDIVVIDVSGEDYKGLFRDTTHYIIKRVIALEGDEIYCHLGQVHIRYAGQEDFIPLEEDYVSSLTPSFSTVTVGEGQMYVLGDNRSISNDSTEAGCLYTKDIFGVVTEWSLPSSSR